MRQFKLCNVILVITICSCASKDDLKTFVNEDTKVFNDKINKGIADSEGWVRDPILIVSKLFRGDDPVRKLVIDLESDSVDKLTITLIQEGLSDDSVDGEKRIIEFRKVDSNWKIESIKLGFKCWEHRGGHTNYSGDLCS